jgi:PKD repeat protein
VYRGTLWATAFLMAGALLVSSLGAQTIVVPAAADTYLRQSNANKNQGQETVLHVQQSGHNRALVRMDQAAIAAAVGSGSLASATLELYVTDSGGWGSDGRTIDLNRLTASWTENGATWNCADDTLPTNSAANCATQWSGGTFEAEASDSVLHTNTTSGYLQFNVTEDVRAFLAGTPNDGWLAKLTDETVGGNVDYVSRQGASGQAPRLVLVVESPAFDQVPPSLAITTPVHSVLINETRPQIGLSYSDGGSGVALSSLAVQVDGVAAVCTPAATSATCLPALLAEGSHTITVSLRDQAGNQATASRGFTLLIGPGRRSATFTAVADTYLRQGNANQTFGGETTLRLRQTGKNRSLARFDTAEIRQSIGQGTLETASLELTIAKNGKNWSKTGRTVDVHRLTADWAEAGATWNCGIDTQPTNNQADCSPQWAGGTFQPTPTASVLHTSSLAGTVSFDVTADVASLLAGTSDYGWLVKKREEDRSGQVDYASREAGTATAPRLVVYFDVPTGPQDTTAPTLAITAPAGTIYSSSAPQVGVQYSDAGSGVDPATLHVSLDGGELPCTAAASGASCPYGFINSGSHSIHAEIRDFAGNLATAAGTFVLILDDTAPVVSFTTPDRPEYYPDEVPELAGTIGESGSDLDPATFRVAVDGQDVTAGCVLTAGGTAFHCPQPALTEGPHVVVVTVSDRAGNSGDGTAELRVVTDSAGPVLRITSPADTAEGTSRPRIVAEYVDDRSGVDLSTFSLQVDGTDLTATCDVQAASAACTPPALAEGVHVVAASLADRRGNRSEVQRPFQLSLALGIAVTAPDPGAVTREASTRLAGTASPLATAVRVGDLTAPVTGGSWVLDGVPLREGSNALTVVASSPEGGIGTATVIVIRDTEPPHIAILSPRDGFVTSASQIVVSGDLTDSASSSAVQHPLTVLVNGQAPALDRKSFVLADLLLVPGENRIEVTAEDAAGNVGRSEVTVRYVQDAAARIEKISGDFQEAPVRETLTGPLLVRVVDFLGRPLAGRTVDFAVTRGDGAVISFPDAARKLSAVTDQAGLATMQFALGTRAGAGNQEVTVSSLGIPGSLVFCASARTKPARQLQPLVGTDFQGARSGTAGQPLPKPLLVQAFDEYGNPVPGVEVTFRVVEGGGSFAGAATEMRKVTDEEGKSGATLTLGPGEGINNNVMEAKLAGDDEHAVRFVVTGMIPGPAETTSIAGVLLDPEENPVPGATLQAGDRQTRADAEGRFRLTGVPVGTVHLAIDGTTVTRPGTWPHLAYELVTVSGRENTLGKPLRLPPIDDDGKKWVGGNEDVVVPIRGVAGASLTVFAHSATFPDGSHEGWMSITQVSSFKVPMVAPMGSNFQLAWTLQPTGVLFDPPAKLTIPNFGGAGNGGYARGVTVDLYSFDHDLNEFVSAGTATISEDGLYLVSSPGMGITKAGWGGAPPPPPPPAGGCSPGDPPVACHLCPGNGPPVSQCTECKICTGSGCLDQTVEGYEIFFDQDDSDPGDDAPAAAPRAAAAKAGAAGGNKIGLNAQTTFMARQIVNPPNLCKAPEFDWNFGDGTTQHNVENPKHRYKKQGTFTVTVTVRCTGCDGVSPFSRTQQVMVEATVTLDMVVSNQVPGAECNMLPPNPAVSAGKNMPMRIGAKSGTLVSVVVKGTIQPPSARPLALIGARKAGGSEIIKAVKPPGTAGATPTVLEFDAADGANQYEIVAGFDEDGSGKLEPEEVKQTFPSKLLALTAKDYADNQNAVRGQRNAFFPSGKAAEGLVNVFLAEASTVPGTTMSPDTLTLNEVDHPIGANWTAACTATMNSFAFSTSNPRSDEFGRTSLIVHKAVDPFLAAVRNYFHNNPAVPGRGVSFPAALATTWPFRISTATREWAIAILSSNEARDFALAFGGIGRIDGEITEAIFTPQNDGRIALVELRYHGSFRDVYDFDATVELPVLPIHFTENAANVQGGYPSLGPAGAVMSDRLGFDVDIAPPLGIFFIDP